MMLKATLIAALYGISNGYGPAPTPVDMCCTANVAMSNSYSVCEDVMNRFDNPSQQEDACLNGKFTGKNDKGENTCKWTECNMVGYCVNARDVEYFGELSVRRSLAVEIEREDIEAEGGWGAPKTPRPTVWEAPKTPKPSNPPKTPRPTEWKAPKTPKPTSIKTTKIKTTKAKTPRPTDTPRPTKIKSTNIKTTKVKTPRPTDTPRPTRGIVKTPRPTSIKTTKIKTTKVKTTKVKTTVWKAPKTPKPTYEPKTPRPTETYIADPPKSTYIAPPKSTYIAPPKTTEPCAVPSCVDPCRGKCGANYECKTRPTFLDDAKRCPGCDVFDSCEYVGWTAPKTPMTGCAQNTGKKACTKDKKCAWKMGYPPMEFSEDAEYQLLDEEESFFAVDGSVVEMINNMDSNMLMVSGIVFVAVLLLAIKQCSNKKDKDVYEPIADVEENNYVAVVQ